MHLTKFNLLLLLIILLGILDFFLLYKNAERQAQVNGLKARVSSLEASGFSPEELSFVKEEHIPYEHSMSLVIFFSQQNCSACLSYEIPNFKNLYEKYKERIQAYYIGTAEAETFFKAHGASFPYTVVSSPADVVNSQNVTVTNPVALLIDSSGMIQDIYISETGNHEKSDLFYQRMHSLFESIHPKSPSIETVSN